MSGGKATNGAVPQDKMCVDGGVGGRGGYQVDECLLRHISSTYHFTVDGGGYGVVVVV